MTRRSARFYSDECGGAFTAHYREARYTGECGHKSPYTVEVRKGRTVVWAPNSPLCAVSTKKARIVEDIQGFFEYDRCGRGRLDGLRKKKRRR